jgi:hypothetical protein
LDSEPRVGVVVAADPLLGFEVEALAEKRGVRAVEVEVPQERVFAEAGGYEHEGPGKDGERHRPSVLMRNEESLKEWDARRSAP